jgi:hypothetical protein
MCLLPYPVQTLLRRSLRCTSYWDRSDDHRSTTTFSTCLRYNESTSTCTHPILHLEYSKDTLLIMTWHFLHPPISTYTSVTLCQQPGASRRGHFLITFDHTSKQALGNGDKSIGIMVVRSPLITWWADGACYQPTQLDTLEIISSKIDCRFDACTARFK